MLNFYLLNKIQNHVGALSKPPVMHEGVAATVWFKPYTGPICRAK
jgi:hypothetical protein